MMNFDEARFLRIQTGAVAQAEAIDTAVAECLSRGADNLFFLGTGGAGILMQPATLLLRTQSLFPVFCELPAEIVLTGHKHLNARSIVVIPSLSGTTKESIAVLDYARARGATILVLTGYDDKPLAQAADHAFVNFAEDDTSCESFYLQALFVVLSIMRHRGECPDYARLIAELKTLPALLVGVKKQIEPDAEQRATAIKDAPYTFSTVRWSWSKTASASCCSRAKMRRARWSIAPRLSRGTTLIPWQSSIRKPSHCREFRRMCAR
jgi:fructoselysine-6-phosphate deglycase